MKEEDIIKMAIFLLEENKKLREENKKLREEIKKLRAVNCLLKLQIVKELQNLK